MFINYATQLFQKSISELFFIKENWFILQSAISSKYFEILSHKIRYSILTFLDVHQKTYVEIMDGISSEEIEIRSNKLNFHLKKMVDEGIIVKNDKSYSLSELGMKLLSLLLEVFEVAMMWQKQ